MDSFWPVRFKGLEAFCNAYASDPARGTFLLSLVGSAVVLNGLWAAFVSNETLSLAGGQTLRRLPRLEDDPGVKTLADPHSSAYRTARAPLPETGKRQLVIIHRQATQTCDMDLPFYVLAEEGPVSLVRFHHQFSRAVAACARPEWSAHLWAEGLAGGLITACNTGGLNAWRVAAGGDGWADIIRAGLATRVLG